MFSYMHNLDSTMLANKYRAWWVAFVKLEVDGQTVHWENILTSQ